MLIFNTLSGKKEEFVPINPPKVTFYTCGPTVYDFFHIGNGRTFIMSDILRRYLIFKGYEVQYAMNLTDIDDKIIQKAAKLGKDTSEIAEEFSEAFFVDTERIGIKKADIFPKATEHITDIIQTIQKLIDKNIAYSVNGDVFYNVNKFDGYGKLSGKKIDELESGSRVEINDKKESPLDFALWKSAKPGEPFWDSPWGKGRPGWHIECSAMSNKHFGETIDIHAGGSDLIFPHHENEIAQSEGANGKEFVKYWIHFGFLNIKDEKMSKSLGNFFTVRDILKRHSVYALRLLFTQTHYRGPLNYSEELIDAATRGSERLSNFYYEIKTISENNITAGINFDVSTYNDKFITAMDDDFNTPQAGAVFYELIKDVHKVMSSETTLTSESAKEIISFLDSTAVDVFGIINRNNEEGESSTELTDELINLLLDLRQRAKQAKNYEYADLIRNGLTEIGIELRDSKEGTTYKINK
jgi:cysteinyl-tRNA synthetase